MRPIKTLAAFSAALAALLLSGCSTSVAEADFDLCTLLNELEQPKFELTAGSTEYAAAQAEEAHMWQQAGQQHMSVLGSLVYVYAGKSADYLAAGDADWSKRERDEFASQFEEIKSSCAAVGIELGAAN